MPDLQKQLQNVRVTAGGTPSSKHLETKPENPRKKESTARSEVLVRMFKAKNGVGGGTDTAGYSAPLFS